jgi:hypothetical protein
MFGGLDLFLSDTYYFQSLLLQVGIFAFVALGIAVPIFAVYFQRDIVQTKKEIDAVATDFIFLNKKQSNFAQGDTDGGFNARFTSKTPITRKIAEFALITGACSYFLAAGRADDKLRRSTTCFGTVMTRITFITQKWFSAALTSQIWIAVMFLSAFSGAILVAINLATLHAKDFAATDTSLLDSRAFPVARLRTVMLVIAARMKCFSTPFTSTRGQAQYMPMGGYLFTCFTLRVQIITVSIEEFSCCRKLVTTLCAAFKRGIHSVHPHANIQRVIGRRVDVARFSGINLADKVIIAPIGAIRNV